MKAETSMTSAEMRGAGEVLSLCARVFSQRPSAKTVEAVRDAASVLGYGELGAFSMSEELDRRFDERFAVPTSPLFVPLTASAVLQADSHDGHVSYGALSSRVGDWVTRCYHTAGFDAAAARESLDSLLTLHDDSLAVELLFVSSLIGSAADLAKSDPTESAARLRLSRDFASRHLSKWLERAVRFLREGDADYYASCAELALEVLLSL